jgi:acyl-CoA reductase-like NAD-dependent aldehyde dehydrogenase
MTTQVAYPPQRLYIDGQWVETERVIEITNPYDGAVIGRTYEAGAEEVERAVASVVRGAKVMRELPAYDRAAILQRIAERIRSSHEELARTIALEAGKPIRDARIEVDRAVLTMETSAAEATRIYGEELPLDVTPAAAGRIGITRRVPIGPVLAITPFNFPLNLVCHKLGPAIAAGNSVFLKPAPKTPLSALALARIVADAGLPADGLAVVLCSNEQAQALVGDERFKLLTFTGSDTVGWRLKSLAGKKKVILELGGNAGVIVDETADLDFAAARIAD